MTLSNDSLQPLTLGQEAARLPYASPLFVGQPAPGEGWVRLGDLCDPGTGALNSALQAMAKVRRYPLDDGRTLGSSFVLITASALSGAIIRLFGGEGIVAMPPAATWWQMVPAANVRAVAVEAAQPIAVPPLGEASAADLAQVRAVLFESLGPLFETVHQLTGVPVRAQWALATSVIGDWLLRICADDPAQPQRVAEALFADGDLLWRARPRFWSVEWAGRRYPQLTRRVCCYNFNKIGGGAYCNDSCPLLPHAGRAEHALGQVKQRHETAGG